MKAIEKRREESLARLELEMAQLRVERSEGRPGGLQRFSSSAFRRRRNIRAIQESSEKETDFVQEEVDMDVNGPGPGSN